MHKYIATLFLFFVSFSTIAANDLSIVGNVTYQVNGSAGTVSFTADRIENNSSTRKTGTLYIELWATESPNPIGDGHTLATFRLGELEPNYYFYDLDLTADFSPPSPGTYYIHAVLVEFPELDTRQDSVTFDNRQTFGEPPPPDPGNGSELSMSGAARYVVNAGTGLATLAVEKISNSSRTRTSGTLFLRLRMTTGSSPTSLGYDVAEVRLDQLSPGFYYENIEQVTDYVVPPDGTYYVHMVLVEYPNLTTQVSSMTFPETLSVTSPAPFSPPPPPPPVNDPTDGPSNPGGGGGGGSLGLLTLGLLIAAGFRRRRRTNA